MNSKMIAIIAVVAMCGAALVGVGYAYTATFQDDAGNANITVDYITPTGASMASIGTDPVKFEFNSTNIDGTGLTYTLIPVDEWEVKYVEGKAYATKVLGEVIFTAGNASAALDVNKVTANSTYVKITQKSNNANVLTVTVTAQVLLGECTTDGSNKITKPTYSTQAVDLSSLQITYSTA